MRLKYGSITLASLTVILLGFSCSGSAHTERQISLQPGQKSSLALDLSKGNVVHATAIVVGDQSVDIGLSLEDAAAKVVVAEKRGHSVELTYGAVAGGMHHLIVDNSYSLVTGKVVSVSIKIDK